PARSFPSTAAIPYAGIPTRQSAPGRLLSTRYATCFGYEGEEASHLIMPSRRLVAPAMRDVARLAGVAPITVSRALSGHPSVRPETRQIVVRAANELGYVHNFMASALLRRGSKLIALVVPNVSNSVFAETIHGLEEVLSAEGYTLTIGHSGYSQHEE